VPVRCGHWIACLTAVLTASGAHADDRIGCDPAGGGNAIVRSVLDERSLLLADGREVRLAGVEIPRSAPHAAARTALTTLAGGQQVALKPLGGDTDRYGRVPALVLPILQETSGDQRSVQHALLAHGLALVAARVGDRACAAAFLAAERDARRRGLGLWASAAYVIKQAAQPREIAAERGRFTLVEGTVLSVRESGNTIYVNFGRRWSEDFTVTVPKRKERAFAAAGMKLEELTGRRVRVRGVIEERGGPWIEAAYPEQIEIAVQN
jgi:endonuclease YncB( thermonuclease family)